MDLAQYRQFQSSVAGISWPFLPGAAGARMLSLQYQYDYTQWLPHEELRSLQFTQLQELLGHAVRQCPYYRDLFKSLGIRPGEDPIGEYWSKIPLLERGAVQKAGARIFAGQVPADHGEIKRGQTSGSTGAPVSFRFTGLTHFLFLALGLRDHLWHRRDFSKKLVAIRPEGDWQIGKGFNLPDWGPGTGVLVKTGPASVMNVRTDIATQAAWLREQQPVYLHSTPSNLLALARYCRDHGILLPGLREVKTYAEQLPDELRQVCREIWQVPVKDMYSAQELGYIALQCPEHEHYHIQAENALVEIVDDSGRQVGAGEIGRVAVTPFHNFAMPLIRYLVGDYAEYGGKCPCGRGLPVINKVLGRQRNMLTLPDGRQVWPSFPAEGWSGIGSIRQLQLRQSKPDCIVASLVVDSPMSGENEQQLVKYLQERFCYPFTIEINYVPHINRSKGGKFEDFISLL